ncbi:hypothetical protein AAE485_14025 [Acidithiobacillus ferriphilus]|uniref:hypothetical protein n=1 Tax=Acidithiobacillus ferriphilus TaxID=1689834 RepID=UPI00390C7AD6
MNEEKIIEAQALAQDAQVAPAPVAADLVAEARELAAEGWMEADHGRGNNAREDPESAEAISETAEEAIDMAVGSPLPDMAVLPTGGILEMGHVINLLCAAVPDTGTGDSPDATRGADHGTVPTPENPVYGAVYGRRH